jgi:hypothetical protein
MITAESCSTLGRNENLATIRAPSQMTRDGIAALDAATRQDHHLLSNCFDAASHSAIWIAVSSPMPLPIAKRSLLLLRTDLQLSHWSQSDWKGKR